MLTLKDILDLIDDSRESKQEIIIVDSYDVETVIRIDSGIIADIEDKYRISHISADSDMIKLWIQ